MCGRFTLRTPAKDVARMFAVESLPLLEPRYNIAPTQPVAAVRLNRTGTARELVNLQWGLVPSWAADPDFGARTINARAETAATKPAFRAAFKSRRCLIPADGFYEWQRQGARKQPYYIRLRADAPFAFAGLWEHWEREGKTIDSCTLLTTTANALMAPIHDRMPVILDPAAYADWLDPNPKPAKELEKYLVPFRDDALIAIPVSTLVNNPRHESPECIAPVAGADSGLKA